MFVITPLRLVTQNKRNTKFRKMGKNRRNEEKLTNRKLNPGPLIERYMFLSKYKICSLNTLWGSVSMLDMLKSWYSELLRRIVWYISTNVSEEELYPSLGWKNCNEKVPLNVGTHLPNHTESHLDTAMCFLLLHRIRGSTEHRLGSLTLICHSYSQRLFFNHCVANGNFFFQ
jgi:hypothetical protein